MKESPPSHIIERFAEGPQQGVLSNRLRNPAS
jgi:hypothetical protein